MKGPPEAKRRAAISSVLQAAVAVQGVVATEENNRSEDAFRETSKHGYARPSADGPLSLRDVAPLLCNILWSRRPDESPTLPEVETSIPSAQRRTDIAPRNLKEPCVPLLPTAWRSTKTGFVLKYVA